MSMLNRRAAIICACFIVPAAGLPDDLIPTDRDPVLYPTYRAVIVKKLSDYIEFWYVKGGRIAYSVVDASHYRAVRTPEKMESIEDQWHSRRRREASQRPDYSQDFRLRASSSDRWGILSSRRGGTTHVASDNSKGIGFRCCQCDSGECDSHEHQIYVQVTNPQEGGPADHPLWW